MINGKNFFNQPVKNDKVTYENVRKISTGQGDDYTSGCLLDYTYFKKYYKMIAIDLSKQQALDADPKAIQQINFTANLDRAGNTTMFFIIEEAKETVLDFSQGIVKVQFNFYQYKMTQYNSLNAKLSNSQLNQFKISDNETNFLHKLLLTNR